MTERVIKKTIYIADDNTEFNTMEACRQYEETLRIKGYFERLDAVGFFERFKIEPYFHNVQITNLGRTDKKFKKKLRGYILMNGSMGNGNDYVSFSLRPNDLIILRENTGDSEYKYLGEITLSVFKLEGDAFKEAIDKYLSERKVFVKVPVTTYITKEI